MQQHLRFVLRVDLPVASVLDKVHTRGFECFAVANRQGGDLRDVNVRTPDFHDEPLLLVGHRCLLNSSI